MSNMLVQLSGPTGSGKSSAADILHQRGFAIIREQHTRSSPICGKEIAMSGPFEVQKRIMLSRLDQYKQFRGCDRLALDRSVDEDYHVFCRLFSRIGLLEEAQLHELAKIRDQVKNELPKPKVILFLTATPEELTRRLHVRGEGQLILQTIELQLQLYSEWKESLSSNVIDIDTTDLNAESYWPILKEVVDA